MDVDRLLQQIAETRRSLFVEGHLNENFTILENFETEYNMEFFTRESLVTYFVKSALVLTRVEQELERVPRNVDMLETLLNQIRKYTMSVGANNVLIKLNQLRDLVDHRHDAQSCQNAMRELKLERERFKSRMELYFGMKELNPPLEISDNSGWDDETSDNENN